MESVKELGLKKTFKFVLFSFLEILYTCIFLPPLRKYFLILLGAKIGKSTNIMRVKFFNWHQAGPGELVIGKKCYLGDEVLIDLYGPLEINNQVTVAQRVTILTHISVGYADHPLQKYFPKKSNGVKLAEGSVIGASSTILPGIKIGRNSFIAAGSVVTKDVAPNKLVAGVPAKVIRAITNSP